MIVPMLRWLPARMACMSAVRIILPTDARRILGPQAIIGVTLKSTGDLAQLDPALVNYGCIGGVFSTSSKDNPDAPVGLAGLSRLRQEARSSRGLPVGAIAGIDAGNAADVIAPARMESRSSRRFSWRRMSSQQPPVCARLLIRHWQGGPHEARQLHSPSQGPIQAAAPAFRPI
jgi:hypothetical protein